MLLVSISCSCFGKRNAEHKQFSSESAFTILKSDEANARNVISLKDTFEDGQYDEFKTLGSLLKQNSSGTLLNQRHNSKSNGRDT